MHATLTQQTVSLATALLLLVAATGCSRDTNTETPAPGSARIEVQATGTDGNTITLNNYHLYTFGSEGEGTLSNTFSPGSLIPTDGVAHLTIAATKGNGKLSLPGAAPITSASLIRCDTDSLGNATPLPALFLSDLTEVKTAATLAIPLTCRTALLRFRVTGDLTLASSLRFLLREMPAGIQLDGTLPATDKLSLPIDLAKEADAFIATANCLPVADACFEYNQTDSQTGTFSLGQLEAGKSYTVGLTLRDNTIKVGNVTINDWASGETIDGGEALN